MNSDKKKRILNILSTSILFGIIGGFLGGFFVGFLAVVTLYLASSWSYEWIMVPMYSGLVGIMAGFIPACITGVWVSIRKLSRTKKHYFEMFLIGGLFSALYLFWWLDFDSSLRDIVGFMQFGGFSAMIVGRLVLSKE